MMAVIDLESSNVFRMLKLGHVAPESRVLQKIQEEQSMGISTHQVIAQHYIMQDQ
jgi:hypothetical protein